jgi:hypothetical protein
MQSRQRLACRSWHMPPAVGRSEAKEAELELLEDPLD